MADVSTLKKAEKLEEVYSAFRTQPLQLNELDDFFVETESARGGKPVRKRLARLLERETGSHKHILLVGYKGSGKSTELNRLQKDISDDFLVVNFSVFSELDPAHLNYIELFIVTLERLFKIANDKNISINKEYIDNIVNWMNTREIQEIRDKYIGAEVEVGTEAKIGILALVSFFSKLRASAKNSQSFKETIKQNIEPKLADLIEQCNLLITEIKLGLPEIGKKDILIIIEDLDKIPVDRAEELFCNYSYQLVQLQCNVVFTFPISSYFNIRSNSVKPLFTDSYELPMIKVSNKDESDCDEGIEMLIKIVEKRMLISLFEKEDLLKTLIKKSGGCIRDLFRLIAEASEYAIDLKEDKISGNGCNLAILSLKREYDSTIADNYRNGKKIEAAAYYEALVKVAKNPTKKIDNTEEIFDLRQNLCILGYNGEGWCDVHPIVKDILKEKGRWNGKQDDPGQ